MSRITIDVKWLKVVQFKVQTDEGVITGTGTAQGKRFQTYFVSIKL